MTGIGEDNAAVVDHAVVLDLDATVNCLYGKQKGAVAAYNSEKPSRPSHRYHSAVMAKTWVAVDILPGNETAPLHSMPGI
ncbi:MAG: hypothetical protein P0121_07490 [Nitrospira sp.]|nr:hypothetical protein [Nitrospira sp.]